MEKSVQQIMQVIGEAGFPGELEWAVQVHLCFSPSRFSIPFEQYRGTDRLRYQIWIAQSEQENTYVPLFYDACLIRPLDLKVDNDCAEMVVSLNQQMQLINWGGLLEKAREATVGDLSELNTVQQVVARILELQASSEGAHYAHLLKMRYWGRTPFEAYTNCSNQVRSEYEVCQRFHFFEDGGGITLEEAYRFLLHRWREKQVQLGHRAGRVVNGSNRNRRSK